MSKIFKRPMFRKGGPTNGMTGIMSGIQDRQNYQKAGYVTDYFGEEPKSAQELGYDFDFAVPTFKQGPNQSLQDLTKQYQTSLLEAAGERGGYDPLTTFLLQYGPSLATTTGGSLVRNLVAAADKPLQAMLKEKAAEDKFKRGIRLQATGKAIETKEAQDKAAMEIENKLQIAEADVINKGKELRNKIMANKELTQFERDNLLTQLANNRQLALEKLRIQSDNAKELLQMELDADDEKVNIVDELKISLPEYGSALATQNRRAYENEGLEKKAMETFKGAFKGGEEAFIGSIHGYGEAILNTNQVPAAWKKNNEGNIFYDVTDGSFKQLRKNKDKTYSYKKLDLDKYSPEEENDIEGSPEKKSTSLSREDAEVIAEERGFILIGDPPPGASRNWMAQEKKRLGPNAVSIEDINKLLEKEKMESLYGSKKSRSKTR